MRRISILLTLVATACSPAEDVLPPPSEPGAHLVTEGRVLRIGSVDGNSAGLLYVPRRPVFVSDSVVSVSNALSEIRQYSLSGDLVRTVGRRGNGPGEFQAAYWHDYPGGSLLVVDQQTRAIVFDQDYMEVSRVPLAPALGFNNAPGVFDGRVLVGLGASRDRGTPGTNRYVRPDVPLWALDLETGRMETLDRVPGRGMWFTPDDTGWGLPLGPRPALAARGDWIAYSDGLGYRLRTYRTSEGWGEVILGLASEPVTSRALDRWVQEMGEIFEERGAPPAASVLPDADPPLFDTMPGWTRLFFDHSSCLWALRYQFPNSTEEAWDVLDPRGGWVATFESPPGFRLNDVRGNLAVGLESDEVGVEYLSVLTLNRRVGCELP
ncbi:MAG: hypothetical protein ACF8NJ_07775 [Phycisphaerales bacterium JB038]